LKRGWTPFWRGGSALLLTCIPAQAFPQAAASPGKAETNVSTVTTELRKVELTLAGLRPGRDDLAKAERFFSKPSSTEYDGTSHIWQDPCRHQLLAIIPDPNGMIQQVRVAQAGGNATNSGVHRGCESSAASKSHWTTGHGLVVGNSCSRVLALYGQPGSRGPSTKDGQQLELLYYAFDWAGPDVPQVMAVLCTPAKDAKPGRVVEITLMAPSL
jgi:hypothetical protein